MFVSPAFQAGYRLMDYDIQRSIVENSKTPDGGDPVKLSIQHILGAIFLWTFGTTIAAIFFALEILWNHNEKKVMAFVGMGHRKFRKLKKKFL